MLPALELACWPTIENTATAFGLRVTSSRIVNVPVTVAGAAIACAAGIRRAATKTIAVSADSLRGIAFSVDGTVIVGCWPAYRPRANDGVT